VDTSNTDESEILKLSKADKESYASLFASVLVSHTDVIKDEIIGQGETQDKCYLCYNNISLSFAQVLSVKYTVVNYSTHKGVAKSCCKLWLSKP
jgi:hypothetical protein